MKLLHLFPSYNEEKVLEETVSKAYDILNNIPELSFLIVISDNMSTDSTSRIGKELAKRKNIEYFLVETKGKGANIKQPWFYYDGFDSYSFSDVNKLTLLDSFPELIKNLKLYDMVIGSRYLKEPYPKRKLKRRIVSKGYRILFNYLFDKTIKDPQCGFKAISKDIRYKVLPDVDNDGFFFDTELIVKAKNAGYSVKEIPVKWKEQEKSSVKLVKDSSSFIWPMLKLKYEMMFR